MIRPGWARAFTQMAAWPAGAILQRRAGCERRQAGAARWRTHRTPGRHARHRAEKARPAMIAVNEDVALPADLGRALQTLAAGLDTAQGRQCIQPEMPEALRAGAGRCRDLLQRMPADDAPAPASQG